MMPIIKCQRWRSGLMFYCKYCKKTHKHGFGNGSRSPHCSEETPYTETDYYLILEEEK